MKCFPVDETEVNQKEKWNLIAVRYWNSEQMELASKGTVNQNTELQITWTALSHTFK